jgi:ribose-phosphate pyrophosphokinase
METGYQVRVLTGNSNPELAKDICNYLQLEQHPCRVSQFANGEIDVKILDNIRGDDVFIVQSTCSGSVIDINTALMELLLMIHTARLASAKRITAVVPYFAYSRQDRKTQPRVPISASAVAQLIQEMGVDRVYTVDLHCGQIQGFFRNMPLDNLVVFHEFVKFIKDMGYDPMKTCVVSPDAGGVDRAVNVANLLMASHVVTILKRRVEAGKVDSMQTVGDVAGYTCYIFDDMIDTGGTLVKACDLLKSMGATRVIACATHGILTEPCIQRINDCAALELVVVTDSIPQGEHKARCPKLSVLPLAPLLAEAIIRVHSEASVSAMFAGRSEPKKE